MDWPDHDQATACPRCKAAFTTTFRRHHCRHCSGLVCDTCSRHRLRLPGHPNSAKVRVCDSCEVLIGESQATVLQEDLAVNQEIVEQLKGVLNQSFKDCEAFKRVLLELEAAATGDSSAVAGHLQDPESDEHSFPKLLARVQTQWEQLRHSLQGGVSVKAELQERLQLAREKLEATTEQESLLLERHGRLDKELVDVVRMEEEKEMLTRLDAELERKVTWARRRVRELELERREMLARRGPQASPPGSPGPVAFTISTGRVDGPREGRLDGCRKACCVM